MHGDARHQKAKCFYRFRMQKEQPFCCYNLKTKYWGELLPATARARGATGAVLNGWHRDTKRRMLHYGVSVFYLGVPLRNQLIKRKPSLFGSLVVIGWACRSQIRRHRTRRLVLPLTENPETSQCQKYSACHNRTGICSSDAL